MSSFLHRKYICPDCDGEFLHTHEILSKTDLSPPPDYCPLCGAYVSVNKKKGKRLTPPKPRDTNRGGRTRARNLIKSENQVYRQMESSSEYRMEQAANMLGVDKHTLSHMKTTNMKDNVKSGETSYIPQSHTPIAAPPGQEVKAVFNDGTAMNSHFGQIDTRPQGPNPELQRVTNVISQNHERMVQATVAAGRKK